jgi:hypothetical protein
MHHAPPLPDISDIPEQTTHYHILGFEIWGFIANLTLPWLQDKDDSFVCHICRRNSSAFIV